jgi:hypothetical protein
MQTESTKDKTRDEIDLLHLLERSLFFLKRYRWIFIISLLLGLALGFYLYKKTPNTFASSMLVHSFLLTNQEEIQIVNNWNRLLSRKEYGSLARQLNMREADLRKIKKIEAQEVQQVFNPVNPHGFTIEATVTDTAVLDPLQAGLVYGFENTPYVKEKLHFNREALKDLVRKTEAEAERLDSSIVALREIIHGKRTAGGLVVNASDLNTDLVSMNEKLVGLRRDLQFMSAVQVLHGFEKFGEPSDPNLLPLLVIGVIVFLALGYLVAIVLSVNKALRKRRV